MRLVMALLPGLLLAMAGCDRQSAPEAQGSGDASGAASGPEMSGVLDLSHRGDAMPGVPFTGPRGESLTLSSFKGRPLLVNLWATWCGPCVAEMPTLDALAEREKARLQVIVVSQDRQGREVVDRWWRQRDFRLLQPYAEGGSQLLAAYGVDVLPTTILYDAQGRELWRVTGAMDWNGPRANTMMAEAFGPS